MAVTQTTFAVALLLSLAAIAAADYYVSPSPPVYLPKPTLPPPVYKPEKKQTLPPPVYKPTLPPPAYKPTHPPPVYKPEPNMKPPTAYAPPLPPPVYKPTLPPPVYKPEPNMKPPTAYAPPLPPPVYKPTLPPPVYKPKPNMKPPTTYAPPLPPPVYVPTLPPPVYKPKPNMKPPTTYAPPLPHVPTPAVYTPPAKPYVPEVKLTVAIEGITLCKAGYNAYPIKGAKAKVVCPVLNSYGKVEAEVVITSNPTDAKGYFYLTLNAFFEKVKDISVCKVKLESSPLATCKIPTNVNKGVTGVPLSLYSYRIFSDKNLKLYSVGPFFFSGSKAPKPHY